MRKGVAMLITMMMLAALSLLLLKNLDTSSAFFEDDRRIIHMASLNRLYKDTQEILKAALAEIEDPEAFDIVFISPFSVPLNDGIILYNLSPIDNRLNPNHLLQGAKINAPLYSMFEDILLHHNVRDPAFFLTLLVDTLDADTKERLYGSEITTNTPLFQNGHIYSQAHFDEIMDYYAQNRDDKTIYALPWKEYIHLDADTLDFNFIPASLLERLLPYRFHGEATLDVYYDTFEELNLLDEDKARLESLGVGFKTSRVHVSMLYAVDKEEREVEFVYDIEEEKSSRVKYTF